MVVTHYQLLGIPEDADSRQIKAAYRSMAKRFHPDANKGSEAAAELFRKINEAYRILNDAQLRTAYDRQIPRKHQPTETPQPVRAKPTQKPDPQQKFNNFLYSVLGAILETPDSNRDERPRERASPAQRSTRKVRRKPDFNFYYYLAMERRGNQYDCDEDGIYRRSKGKARAPTKQTFGRVPGNSVVMLLLTGLWEFFKQ